ncbi:MAG: ABC transporter ATP-binding protein, partial [Microcoleus sp. SIO2G3]|nr:ABC transporter ATP-binding protein [Microcoleus sp. SIO2G3]
NVFFKDKTAAISAKLWLESAIQNYDGTVIVVSHDRYFISQVANKIVEIRDGELRLYRGDYHYYLDKLAEEQDKARLEAIEAAKAAKAAAKREKQKQKEKAKKA